MAIIQVSRVQVRRGRTSQAGFPQLASGEFGWSIDEQQLYIGNGAVSEGAPAVGNTRILTTNDTNFFLLTSPNYIYSNTESGPTVQTGPNSDPYVTRTIQKKLDDIVNLNDFIANETFATSAIQRAINHVSTGTLTGSKKLIFPEGTYVITGTIFLPPNTEISGAGRNKSIIINNSTSPMFQTVDGLGRTLNSIASSTRTPQNVRIDGITFQSSLTNANPIMNLDCLSDSIIEDCEFRGNFALANNTSTMATAVSLRGNGSVVCDNVTIKDCVFRKLSNGVVSDYDVKNINITRNTFKDLDAGISFAKTLTGLAGRITGPTRVNITENNFSVINKEGLFVGANVTGVSSIKSSNNSYTNVGIGFGSVTGEIAQRHDVISFNSFGNSSVDDSFARLDVINTSSVAAFTSIKPVVYGPGVFGAITTKPVSMPGVGTFNVFVWPKSTYTITSITSPGQNIEIDYVLTKSNTVRRGTLSIAVKDTSATIADNFTYNGVNDGDTIFSVDLSRSDAIIVKANNIGINGTISYNANVSQ